MRARRALLAIVATCACAGGPLLASVAGQGPAPAAAATPTSPQTIPATSTTTTTGTPGTGTTATQTSSTTTPAEPREACLGKARRVVAGSLRVRVANVGVANGVGKNGMPQCTFVVARPHSASGPHTGVRLIVNVDSAPQAAWRLMRTVVEASQLFGPAPPGWHAPIGLLGLGQYASWFINLHTLMCVNHTRTQLLSVAVAWRHATRGEMIGLARATVEPYVHAPAKAVPIPNSGY